MEKCIVFCDDDTDILEICRLILETDGIKVITCPTAEALYSSLTLHTPNLIFVDNGLRGMAGGDLIAFLKQNEQYKNIPVLLFSANSEIEKLAKRANADGWLAKPFNIVDLKTTVKTYLN